MNIQRGFRDKLDKYVKLNNNILVQMNISGGAVYDYCCFGVDINDKLSDDRYMVFYNQPQSPNSEICYSSQGNGALFNINLSKLPAGINKLVFTVSIDGNGTMETISSHTLVIKQNNVPAMEMTLSGSDFHSEKAIISIEIYKKDVWRIATVARGFNGGLGELLHTYGGTELTNNSSTYSKPKAPTIPTVPPIVEQKTEKISLKKGEKVSLTKNDTGDPIIIENGWTANGKDYDLKALVRYHDGRLVYIGAANADESLSTPDGAVKHGGDIKLPGELERITIKWHKDIASVAVSSYSALENGAGSFKQYGVFVRIKNGRQVIEIHARDASADVHSYTLCFGEIIFGSAIGAMEIVALEMYSMRGSEKRIGYSNGHVMMDIGPEGHVK